MTTPRELERLIASVLVDGPTELPDRSYDAVRAEIDRTRQRVVIGPWRTPDMSAIAKFAVGAAAVVAVSVLGFNVLGGSAPPTAGGLPASAPSVSPSPSATASPSPSPSPSVSPTTPGLPSSGLVPPGEYLVESTSAFNVRLTVPAGWIGAGFYVSREGGESPDVRGISFWTVDNVTTDPCTGTWADPVVGPTVGDLVTALSAQPGRAQGPPEAVSVDGHPGQRLVLAVPDIDFATCQGGRYVSWTTFGGGLRWQQGPGQIQELLIVDVDGERIVIDVSSFPDTPADDLDDLQSMVDSIRIEAD